MANALYLPESRGILGPCWANQRRITKVNWRNPLTRGLWHCWNFGDERSPRGCVDLVDLKNVNANLAGQVHGYASTRWGLPGLGVLSSQTGTKTLLGDITMPVSFTVCGWVEYINTVSGAGSANTPVIAWGAWNSGGFAGTNEWSFISSNSGTTGDRVPRVGIEIGSTIYSVADAAGGNWEAGDLTFFGMIKTPTELYIFRSVPGVSNSGISRLRYSSVANAAFSSAPNKVSARRARLGHFAADTTMQPSAIFYDLKMYNRALNVREMDQLYYQNYLRDSFYIAA